VAPEPLDVLEREAIERTSSLRHVVNASQNRVTTANTNVEAERNGDHRST
jgi:hypothetical protein